VTNNSSTFSCPKLEYDSSLSSKKRCNLHLLGFRLPRVWRWEERRQLRAFLLSCLQTLQHYGAASLAYTHATALTAHRILSIDIVIHDFSPDFSSIGSRIN
jgi:hypothetical protein